MGSLVLGKSDDVTRSCQFEHACPSTSLHLIFITVSNYTYNLASRTIATRQFRTIIVSTLRTKTTAQKYIATYTFPWISLTGNSTATMAGTRSSARLNSSPQSEKSTSGTKRKADDSSPSSTKTKRGRPSKEQKTLEETMAPTKDENGTKGEEMKDGAVDGAGEGQPRLLVHLAVADPS